MFGPVLEFRVVHAAFVLLIVGVCARARAAERARVVLEFARQGAAAQVCPDEGTFRALVGARLGYDPFVSESSLTLRVLLVPRAGGLDGRLALTSEGQLKGTRTLRSGGDDCYELAASLALASAVAVDPEGALARQSGTEAPPPVTPPVTPAPALDRTPAAVPPSAPPPGDTGTALGVTIEAGGGASVGMQPGAAPLFRLGARLAGRGWSAGLEGAASLSSEQQATFGTVSAH
ncbi:MAG TPA: hypothetical protein VK524_05350, partial [Polyangiaceae bacterium]|nr:hypothetical protein [Polyangiaceae bacterium]